MRGELDVYNEGEDHGVGIAGWVLSAES